MSRSKRLPGLRVERAIFAKLCRRRLLSIVVLSIPVLLPVFESDATKGTRADETPTSIEERVFRGFGERELHHPEGHWGGVVGQITLGGEVSELSRVIRPALVGNAAICGVPQNQDDSLLVHPVSKGIANCFVYLRRAPDSIHPLLKRPSERVVVQQQKNCMFQPHALVVQVGQTVHSLSGDAIRHNVHVFPIHNQASNVMIAPNRQGPIFHARQSEPLPFQVKCDIHSWMLAYWLVLDHPYAATTDENGRFFIAGLPAGRHEFRIWHERCGYIDRKFAVTVSAAAVTTTERITTPPSLFLR